MHVTGSAGRWTAQRDRPTMRNLVAVHAVFSPTSSSIEQEDGASRSTDLRFRAGMIDTFDAKAAGCTASAFEGSASGSDGHNGRGPGSGSSWGSSLSLGASWLMGRAGLAGSSASGKGKTPSTGKGILASMKLSMGKTDRRSYARTALKTYRDVQLERAYTLWHARQRWQVESAMQTCNI